MAANRALRNLQSGWLARKAFRGITRRVALLAWLLTLAVLALFVMLIIPQQEAEFQWNLESKAQGVAAALQGDAAGAAISEDYSAVVERALQVLAGDPAIDFLVITKNDGFSVVTERSRWRIENLAGIWRPESRTPRHAIGPEPLFGRRVFHYSTPFDYSGIQWGWIHVGLSLETYDKSLERAYQRTGALTLVCGVFSLLVSMVFVSRLVKPIHTLHAAVEKVASGDLEARADVRSGDEIERLATAFNQMAETILIRNRILESVGFAAQTLLRAPDWIAAMDEVLASLGTATGVCRASVFEVSTVSARPACEVRREWISPRAADAGDCSWPPDAFEERAERLAANHIVTFETQTGQSSILVPIVVGGAWWGLLSFHDSGKSRTWSEAERDSLRAAANILGATIMRQNAQSELMDAKATLERRVLDRTSELREQIEARDRAHAELAAAQQSLLELSRRAGMAEVATGVLHNVGNVLNSVNVAATIAIDRLRQSKVENLVAVASMLNEHEGRLDSFLKTDQRGVRVLPYFTRLARHMARERDGIVVELVNLGRHVEHIKEIVAAQQGYAKTSGFIERVSIPRLLDDAVELSKHGLEKDSIALRRHVADLPEVLTDKHKVLQIVLNLVRNARDAVRLANREVREIHLHAGPSGPDSFEIRVTDNGVGLRTEDLQRIFQHGFTTKAGGHGFGLHSGALAAKDLGGRLTAFSDGPGAGATFVLLLPVRAPARNGGIEV